MGRMGGFLLLEFESKGLSSFRDSLCFAVLFTGPVPLVPVLHFEVLVLLFADADRCLLSLSRACADRSPVHLIRNSLEYASYKDRKPLAAALRPIYAAASEAAAQQALRAFAEGQRQQTGSKTRMPANPKPNPKPPTEN